MLELDSCAVDVNIPFITTASIPTHSFFLKMFLFFLPVLLVRLGWLRGISRNSFIQSVGY